MRRKHHSLGGRRRRRMHGRGIGDFLKKANSYLRDSKIISKVANTLSDAGIAPGITGNVAKVASVLGYGRHRRHRMHHRGGALKLAGMGLSPAGGRRHHRRHRY
jgi:hypothetical protein